MPSDSSKELKHQAGERVLCFHGPFLYEAKVIKAEFWDKSDSEKLETGPHYFIHYKGWKQTWDEWVDDSRILKWNEENLLKQKNLKQAAILANKKKSSPSTATSTTTAPRKTPIVGSTPSSTLKTKASESEDFYKSRKRGRDAVPEKEEETVKKPDFRVPVPNSLKVKLIDDWEQIAKEKLLVPLPRSPTVSHLVNQYSQYLIENVDKRKSRKNEEISNEVLAGLKLYFDKALGTILLYRFERYQYQQILKDYPDTNMSDIYGAEHLLRLFVQLPSLVSQTNMDDESLSVLKDYIGDFLRYMQKNLKTIFVEKYDTPPPSYVSVAKAI